MDNIENSRPVKDVEVKINVNESNDWVKKKVNQKLKSLSLELNKKVNSLPDETIKSLLKNFSGFEKEKTGSSALIVLALQSLLVKKGYNIKVDGMLGDDTIYALEQAVGLEKGFISIENRQKLDDFIFAVNVLVGEKINIKISNENDDFLNINGKDIFIENDFGEYWVVDFNEKKRLINKKNKEYVKDIYGKIEFDEVFDQGSHIEIKTNGWYMLRDKKTGRFLKTPDGKNKFRFINNLGKYWDLEDENGEHKLLEKNTLKYSEPYRYIKQ